MSKIGKFSELNARKIVYQIIDGISYCHERRIVHKDLKLENVLFKVEPDDDNLDISIIDFGIAGVVVGGVGEAVDAGSLPYMAPEVLSGSDADTSFALDVWAIGIMFYTMIYGKLPFYHESESKLKEMIIEKPLKFDPSVPVSE
jgi:serine/threonine protein kinase